MPGEVIRQDIIEVSFEVDDKPIEKAESGIDKLVKSTSKLGGSGGVNKITQGFQKIANSTKKLTEGAKGVTGFSNAVKNIGKVSVDKVTSGLTKLGNAIKTKTVNAAKNLWTNLKKLPGVALNGLITGVKKLGSGLTSALKSAGKLAVKLGGMTLKGMVAGIGAGVAGLTALGTAAINGYAEYEQLIGGVETLFKDSSSEVVKNANNAFKTAGMSANEYMTTVTSFSASLLQSLGGDTKAATAKADQAITDMADNANKMGTDIGSIQNAYQGFAKQNYTMLDNLKLGYGGTKEEMQRLLKDAEKLSGQKFDISSYADVVDAIHVVQKEMGITGTTAKEASGTIQGSFGAMKSAWSNFLTGMADPKQDFTQLVVNLIQSVETFADNLIPRIQALLPRLVSGIARLANSLVPRIPPLLNDLLPVIVDGAISLVDSLATTLESNAGTLANTAVSLVSKLITAFINMLPRVLAIGGQLLLQLCSGIAQQLPSLIQSATNMIVTLANGLVSNIDSIISCALQLIVALCTGLLQALPQLITAAIDLILGLVDGFMQNLPMIIETGLQLVVALIQGLVDAIPQIVAAIPQLISTIIEGLFSIDWLSVGWDLIKAIFSGVWEGAKGLVTGLWNGIKGLFSDKGKETGKAADDGIAQGLQTSKPTVTTAANSVVSSTSAQLGTLGNGTYNYGTTANANLASGLTGSTYKPVAAANSTAAATSTGLSGVSNDTAAFGADAVSNLAGGITGNTGTAVSAASSLSSQVENAASSDVTVKVIGDTGSMNALTSQIGELVKSVSSQLNKLPDIFSRVFAATVQATSAGMNRLATAVTGGMNKVTSIVAGTSLYTSGVQVVNGLVRGMRSQLPAVISTARQIAREIKKATDVELDINSPSGEMEKRGIFTGEGQAVGMLKSIPKIQLAAREIGSASIPLDSYSPDGAGGTVYNSGGDNEYTTISPQFNLTVSGTQDDRATARRIKRYVADAIRETFESMERTGRTVREV